MNVDGGNIYNAFPTRICEGFKENSMTEKSLYLPQTEKDNCGFGLIAHIDGKPSHYLVRTAITSLNRLMHRGAIAADAKTGDGCGLLMKMPDAFMRACADESGIRLPEQYAVGTVFLSQQPDMSDNCKAVFEEQLNQAGLNVAGWRIVPVDPDACGKNALRTLPHIEQVFVTDAAGKPGGRTKKHTGEHTGNFEQRLFTARRRTEMALKKKDPQFYIASLSSKLVSYKGLVLPKYLSQFYCDLNNELLQSSICVFHQRFSTNTWPQWNLAQPFRLLAHNGEINTLRGNRNWAQARSHILKADGLPPLAELTPLVSMNSSDSCSLDNMLEVLVAGGMDVTRAIRLLIPPAWQNHGSFDPDLRACYEYSAMHMEPWDGPAGVVLSDGRYAVCLMDRNGLRPARYVITKDRHITLASETGIYDYTPEEVVTKGRLGPGGIISIDTDTGEIFNSPDIDDRLKTRHPYRKWLDKETIVLSDMLPDDQFRFVGLPECRKMEKMFGITMEEREQVLRVLAEQGQEAVGSMGDDTPLPILSKQTRSLFDYFRQQFAQVTNPPIDPLRESIVMSLETCLGSQQNLFAERQDYAKRVVLDSPILLPSEMAALKNLEIPWCKGREFDLNTDKDTDWKTAIENLCDDVVGRVKNDGVTMIILSDRNIRRNRVPVHALLACGAVNRRLIESGLRCGTNLIVETGSARDPHQCAVLIGFGATAVHPYLAYQSLAGMRETGEIISDVGNNTIHRNCRKGLNKGLYKIMSKMGISTISGYRNAQLFEIIGLNDEVVSLCFRHTVSRIGGIGFSELRDETKQLASDAMNETKPVQHGGQLKYVHNNEQHAFNPDIVQALRRAAESGDYKDYRLFSDRVNSRPAMVLRDLLNVRTKNPPINIDEVEPLEDILKRFDSAGMSLGALSPDAHETLATAMNRLGGRSNSGEGGEDKSRYRTEKNSKIKQVASGRFGVTPEYLTNAEVLQIKIAQGAKPGEGGQLPGHKVTATIAHLRHAKPGISLISPPPHHDIYSIEDLAQLIFDLKQVNPEALVSVKLVSEPGVGTIAVGVAKAYADLITISGYDGGTGASPLTSIKYAGVPWELGLPETHVALRANQLRERVRLQTDGGLKTGLDVIKGAILGAESFGFGTAPMIAMGCKYLRICHLNNCATGVATQNKVLRMKHFIGKTEMVINYFVLVATEVRERLAQLGVRRLADLIGQTAYLEPREDMTDKQKAIDLSPILSGAGGGITTDDAHPHFCTHDRNPPFDKAALAKRMVRDTAEAILNKTGGQFDYVINNTNRSIGAGLSGEIARLHGDQGMTDAPIHIACTGTAGQSFGAWNAGGLHLRLVGDANDYVGKGMAGGEIVIVPPSAQKTASHETPIIGNTCLYGATGGHFYAMGTAGERFAVRNSGATAIVEGVGDHGCEYMTGGLVLVLGDTGLNFGAGMTGGFALVLDTQHSFSDRYNHLLIEIQRIDTEETLPQRQFLKNLLKQYHKKTQSALGKKILDDFSAFLPLFWLVKPKAMELSSLISSLRSAA